MKLAGSVRNELWPAESGQVDVNYGVSIRQDRGRRAGLSHQMGSAPQLELLVRQMHQFGCRQNVGTQYCDSHDDGDRGGSD